MSVTAKFKVSRITPTMVGQVDEKGEAVEAAEIEMTPDYAGGRNKEWARWTPSGVIRMYVSNPAALAQYTQGRAFTVTFDPED